MAKHTKLPDGMWVRGGVYYARFRANGREVRKRLSTNLRAATQMLNDLRARADKADFGLLDNACPWSELKTEFMRWARQSVRDPDNYEEDLAKFEEYTTVKTVSQITFELIYGFREWRLAQKVTARTVNRQVGTIHNMLNKAVQWKRIGSNPIKGIKPLPHDTLAKERRSLTLEEVLAIFEKSPDYLKPVWRMFLCSGIRHSELVEMRFKDVDYERQTVTVRASTAKNHKPREVPLDAALLAMIRDLQSAAKDRKPRKGNTEAITKRIAEKFSREHVFVTKASTPWHNHLLTRFYSVCKKAGIEGGHVGGNVDIHSLRVSFATLALDNGANPKAVQAILGHSTLGMTMRVYSKATEKGKRAVIDSLPFASANAPGYTAQVQPAHSVRTSNENRSQGVVA